MYDLYFILRICNQHLLLPEAHIEDDCSIAIFSFMVMLNLLLTVQGVIKMMFFCRVSEKFGKLVQLVGQCLVDIVQFTIFFTGWICLFSILYRILGMGIASGTYPHLGIQSTFFI